mgnify:CR=1 FL=1
MLFYFLFACAKTPNSSSSFEASVPIVPAPQAEFYSVKGDEPKDLFVAKVAKDLPWSEALSGAAAEIGLNIKHRSLRLDDARWAAIRAGFPYAVHQIIVGDVEIDSYPHDLARLLQKQDAAHVGLVRIRVGTLDRWIALLASDGGLEEGFSREIEIGEELEIKGQGQFRLRSPSGKEYTGALPLRLTADEEGEWWLELGQKQIYSSLPIYVGVGTPIYNLFRSDDIGLEHGYKEEVEEDLLFLLEEMRIKEGLIPLRYDKMLSSLAQYPLQYLLQGNWNPEQGVETLNKAGFVGGPVYQVACQAEHLFACLDQLSWDIDARQALVDPQLRNIGYSMELGTSSISLILNLSSQ